MLSKHMAMCSHLLPFHVLLPAGPQHVLHALHQEPQLPLDLPGPQDLACPSPHSIVSMHAMLLEGSTPARLTCDWRHVTQGGCDPCLALLIAVRELGLQCTA